MKRMLIAAVLTAVAATGFAAPAAQAQDAAQANVAAPCRTGESTTTCVKRILATITDVNVAVCQPGETVDECAERLARWAADQVDPQALITTVFAYVDYAGYLANWAIETAEYYCGQVIRTCDDGDMPLVP